MAVVRGWSVQEATSNQKRKMLKQRLKRWTAGKDVWSWWRAVTQAARQRSHSPHSRFGRDVYRHYRHKGLRFITWRWERFSPKLSYSQCGVALLGSARRRNKKQGRRFNTPQDLQTVQQVHISPDIIPRLPLTTFSVGAKANG